MVPVPQGQTATDYLEILNGGDANLNWSAEVTYLDNGFRPIVDYDILNNVIDNTYADIDENSMSEPPVFTDEIWDIQIMFNPVAAAASQAGVETDGEYIYTAVWNAGDFVKFDLAGNHLETFQISGVAGIRDMAYDGEYFYGGAASSPIYQMDFASKTLIGTIAFSGDAGRAIAYDDEYDAFWTNNWSSNIILVDRSGGILNSIAGSPSIYGLAYDTYTADGPYLWLFEGTSAGAGCWVSQWSISNGPTGLTHDVSGDIGVDAIAGGLALQEGMVPGTYTLLCLGQGTAIIGYELGSFESPSWLTLDPTNGTVYPDESQEVELFFDAIELEEGSYYADIEISSNDPVTPLLIVPVQMDVYVGIEENEKLSLLVYPNPATNLVNLQSNDEIVRIFVMNSIGIPVYNEIVANEKKVTLNTSYYETGIYIVRIETTKGFFTTKVTITK